MGKGYKKDLKGKTFGFLKVIEFAYSKPYGSIKGHVTSFWLCECSKCGNRKIFSRTVLVNGYAKSCGCVVNNISANKKEKVFDTSISDISKLTLSKRNTTGYRGVSYISTTGKYQAKIQFQKKRYSLGDYQNIEDAIAARKDAEKEIYGNFLEWYNANKENFKNDNKRN